MTDNWTSAADRINKAADGLKQLRPVYADILTFHAKLFSAQEESKAQIDLQPVKISSEMLAIKARETLPLVAMSDFVVDIRSAEKLLNQICRIIKTHHPAMADSADALIQAVGTQLTTEELFSCLLKADDVYFEKKADDSFTAVSAGTDGRLPECFVPSARMSITNRYAIFTAMQRRAIG